MNKITNKKQCNTAGCSFTVFQKGGGGGGEKELCACARVCVHVFTVSFIAKVDLPELYKAAS